MNDYNNLLAIPSRPGPTLVIRPRLRGGGGGGQGLSCAGPYFCQRWVLDPPPMRRIAPWACDSDGVLAMVFMFSFGVPWRLDVYKGLPLPLQSIVAA